GPRVALCMGCTPCKNQQGSDDSAKQLKNSISLHRRDLCLSIQAEAGQLSITYRRRPPGVFSASVGRAGGDANASLIKSGVGITGGLWKLAGGRRSTECGEVPQRSRFARRYQQQVALERQCCQRRTETRHRECGVHGNAQRAGILSNRRRERRMRRYLVR